MAGRKNTRPTCSLHRKPGQRAEGDEDQEDSRYHAGGARSQQEPCEYLEACGIDVAGMEASTLRSGRSKMFPRGSSTLSSRRSSSSMRHPMPSTSSNQPPAALGIVAAVEQDLGFPVVPLTTAPIWQTQRRRHLRQPIKDYHTVGNCASVARPDGFGRIWSRRDGRAPLCRGLGGPLPCGAASVGLRYEPRHGSGGMLPARTGSSS
jgi:hypothetical protein